MGRHGWLAMARKSLPLRSTPPREFLLFLVFLWAVIRAPKTGAREALRHGFSWILMDFHGFSWIFIDFHEF